MKTLSPSHPLVLIMVGKPGSGKSFFARQFSNTFRAPIVSYDQLRYELFTEPTFSSSEQSIIDRVSNYQIQELFKTKCTFIIDGGNDTKVSRTKLSTLAQQNGYKTLCLWIQTDDATCFARASKRSTRRLDDVYNISLTSEQFKAQASRLTVPTTENHVVVSGKHTYSAQVRAVLKRLVEPHEAEVQTAHEEAAKDASDMHNKVTTRRPGTGRNIMIR